VITQSGLYNDINGQQFLVTQGLVGYTLVDKKKILFRLFVHPSILARITAVFARIKYVPHIPNSEILFSIADLLIENSAPNGPSVGVVLEGRIFPSVSVRYFVEFYIITGEAFSYRLVISDLKFERSGRLRVLQKPIQSITGTAPWGNQIKSDLGWYIDLIFSMDRLGAMLPVSDGISQSKNPDPDDGLAFLQGEVIV
jgi:hypothetical protein